ncbi:MAG: esterase [Elusimicrobiota bacterium]
MVNLSLPRRRRIGPLDVIEFAAGPEAPTIVCFHGYGANAADLAPLAGEVPLERPARWIFPEAPLEMEMLPSGRMWFPLDEERLERAQVMGKPLDFSGSRPPGLDEAHETARGLVDALETPWNRLILGGFSQGSSLALELALNAPESPLGLYILSGNIMDEESLRRLAPARAGTPFFQSHGTMDPLLGYEGAKRLEEALKEAGLKGELRSFNDGHTIPMDVLVGLGGFLDERIAEAGKEATE